MALREDIRPDRLVALEEEVLGLWASENTFLRSLEARRGARAFHFYDGPPTANGKPGMHHLISRSIKDLVCRWKTMQGFYVERKAGWDTHGLPVEVEAEKKLGLAGKDAIEKLGVAVFNKACRESVFTYLSAWEEFTRRTGYWVDLQSAYITCSNEYVESLWALLAEFHRKGILYKGHKVLPYCPRCGTPLSSHEVGLGFKDVQDPSVFVRFRALDAAGDDLPEAFLVWTTTPWTLPSNVALAVHPDVDYVKVRLSEGGGKTEVLWLAQARLHALKAKPDQVTVLAQAKGSDLVGRRYRRLLDLYDVAPTPNAFTVRPATFVTTTDGTGIVHMAPAYGEDDAAVGRRDGLPVLHPVDARGCFVPGPRAALVAGKPVKAADKDVLRHLKEQGLLFLQETLVHSYPHCWRCDTALLYYARESWYLATTKFRERMIALNRQVAWYPEATGAGRFGQWLENNVDWAVSRDRYWGTPLPVWVCDGCKRQEAVGSVAQLHERGGRLPEPLDLHRPYVDEATWACGAAGCRGTMRRTPEVVDCWFDSGAMPFAQWHYPFENRDKVAVGHPADFISEGVDQTRGWFYSLLAVSTMHADKPAYRAVVSNDMVLDAKGKKMSKSRGNVVDPMALVARFGADASRWYLLASRPVWLPVRFDEGELVELRNRLFGTLASTYAFFALYANADGFDVATAADASPARVRGVLDRWLLSRTHRLVRDVTADLEAFETSRAGKRIADFVVEDLSNWYVRRNRRRFWKGALTPDKREGYETLRTALLTVARLMAPFAPFLTDAMHRALLGGAPGADASVHLARWPVADAAAIDDALESRMDALRTVVSLGHAARNRAGTKVRQPLARLTTGHADAGVMDFLAAQRDVVLDELNVKTLDLVRGFEASAAMTASLNKKDAARRLAALTQPTEEAIARLDAAAARDLATRLSRDGSARLALGGGREAELLAGDVRFVAADVAGGTSEFAAGILVRLDTTVTPELAAEGLAREAVHALQGLRKDRDLKVTDRVRVRWAADGALAAALRAHAAFAAEELLAVELVEDAVAASAPGAAALEVAGASLRVAMEPVAR
ncbi:MAG: isoleucine--tRNA ligase [Planctomycetes bacterium]|nr:isoleucine--tRNA ligase [Planctomycetota bacterium]